MTPRHGNICLVTTTTERFVSGTLVTVSTFLKHHPRLDADVVIIHDGLTEAKREMLAAAFDGVRFASVAPELRDRAVRLVAALPHRRITPAQFYMLDAFRLAGYRKVLVCDSDLLFRAPIGELFDSTAALLCCAARASLFGRRLDAATFLPIRTPDRSGPLDQGRQGGDPPPGKRTVVESAFNSGFLLVDERLTGGSVYSDLLAGVSPESLRDVRCRIGDQPLLNRYFTGRQTMISSTYNFLIPHAAQIRAREGLDVGDAKVLHFKAPIKPWMLDAMLDKVDGRSGYKLAPHFKLWYGAYLDCIADAHLRNRHKGWTGRGAG